MVEFEVALVLVGFLRGVGVVMEVGFVVALVGYIKGVGPVVRVGICSSRCTFLFRGLGVWVEQMVMVRVVMLIVFARSFPCSKVDERKSTSSDDDSNPANNNSAGISSYLVVLTNFT